MAPAIRTYRFKQLCTILEVSGKTLRKELDKMHLAYETREIMKRGKKKLIRVRKDIYYPKEVKKIFDHLSITE